MERSKGFFIVLDGIDGCGKSLHSRILRDELVRAGYRTALTTEPSKGTVGRFIKNSVLKLRKLPPEIETLLFAADRFDHLHHQVLPLLDRGHVVVSDRYVHASLAYQGAQGIDLDWIREVNSFSVKPDLSIYLDVEPEVGLGRKRGARSVLETLDLQRKVRDIFHKLVSSGQMIAVDANGPINDVKHRILSLVLETLRTNEGKAISRHHLS
ncbi:MAG: dTMP kinase [archaeon]